MNVRKLMGRLNATTVKFDTGRGGVPELTNQDIAAAVGMCRNETARELFCWIWWPSSASSIANARQLALREVLREFNARYEDVAAARRELRDAQALVAGSARIADEDRRTIEQLEAAIRKRHERVWPARMPMYARIVNAVVLEIREPRRCPDCGGRETVAAGALVQACARCVGTGNVREYNTWRAEQLGVSESRYRATWAVVYDWIYDMIAELESEAGAVIGAALERDAA